MAKQFVEGGISDCVLALGFEKMQKGSLPVEGCTTNPLQRHMKLMTELRGASDAPPAAQMFGNAGREHMEKYGTTAVAFRQDRRQESSPLGEQSVRAVPEGILDGGGLRLARDLRSADQAAVLSHVGRRGGGDPGQ